MALDFPSSPATNDVFSSGGRDWRYDGTKWVLAQVTSTPPVASTDNAVARFNGTAGVLQNSGVIVDDSNNVTGVGALGCGAITSSGTVSGTGLAGSLLSSASPVANGAAAAGTSAIPSRQDHVHPSDTAKASLSGATFTGDVSVSKASPTLGVSASSGDPILTVDGAAGSLRSVRFRTGTSLRWFFGASSTAESGSDVGSDFRLRRYNDSAAGVSDPIYVWRSTGKVTLGDVGATAGLEFGASGPRVMSGSGSPEGVVTAPIGSVWIDTSATTGAVQWIKASGTGNTGWQVQYGDTGYRNIAAAATPHANTTLTLLRVRRVGRDVTLFYTQATSSNVSDVLLYDALPVGFRPAQQIQGIRNRGGILSAADQVVWDIRSGGQVYYSVAGGSTFYGEVSWFTPDAWPSSLPGSAA